MIRLTALVLVILTTVSFSHAGDAGGFRDLPWGTELTTLKEKGFEKIPDAKGSSSRVESFRNNNDELKIGDAAVEAITYNFLKGELYSVAIDFNGYDNLQRILAYCGKRFGKNTGFMVKEMEYFVSFDSPASGAVIFYQFAKHNFFVRNGRLFIFSRAMDPEQ